MLFGCKKRERIHDHVAATTLKRSVFHVTVISKNRLEAELTKLEQIASTHQNWPQSALKLWHPPLMYPTSLFTGGLRPCGKDVLGLVTSSTARSRVHAARHELDYVAADLAALWICRSKHLSQNCRSARTYSIEPR